MRVAADHDRLLPAGDDLRDVVAQDRLAEDGAAQDVADRAVRRTPHLLEIEFFDAGFVGRNGRALHADAMPLDGVGGVDGDLIARLVACLHPQVVVLQLKVEVRVNQPLTNERPHDPRHLVAVELDDGIVDLDLRHGCALLVRLSAAQRKARRAVSMVRRGRHVGDALWPCGVQLRRARGVQEYTRGASNGRAARDAETRAECCRVSSAEPTVISTAAWTARARSSPRVAWVDHVVDVPLRRRDVGVLEAADVVIDQRLTRHLCVVSASQLATVDDVDGLACPP